MTTLPPEPNPGEKISASTVRDLIRCIRERTLLDSPGLKISRGPNGTHVNVAASKPSSKSNEQNPRQFTIRATVEKNDSDQFRVVIDVYNITTDAVTWCGNTLPTFNAVLDDFGWRNIFTSDWAASLSLSQNIYLNVWIRIGYDDQTDEWYLVPPSAFDSPTAAQWTVSDTPIQHCHKPNDDPPAFHHSYLLGTVTADGNAAWVKQVREGAFDFLDLLPGGTEDDGNNNDNVFSHKAFDIQEKDSDWVILENCYYNVGGKTYGYGTMVATSCAGSIVALNIDMQSALVASLSTYASLSALKAAQEDTRYYIRPLWWFDSSMEVILDMRNMPDLSAWEMQ